MPDPFLVWFLTFPESEYMLVRRIYADLASDPCVDTVSWFMDPETGSNIHMRVQFRLGHYQPSRHELQGLNCRYPSYISLPPSVPLHGAEQSPPPILPTGFKIGEWARKKNHSAVYKILGVQGSKGNPIVLAHVDSKETIEISVLHLLFGYEPLDRPPDIPT